LLPNYDLRLSEHVSIDYLLQPAINSNDRHSEIVNIRQSGNLQSALVEVG